MSQVVTRVGKARVLAIVMGGGQGARLFPLTQERSKPAVPLAGKYRLVDIPISNCINSRLTQIYLLTQFNSASLHRHVSHSYKFDHFSRGFVEILAAEQTPNSDTWYQGTADAVRKNLIHLLNNDFEHLLILSGDQLYRMDFRDIIAAHIEKEAELTVATIPVGRELAKAFGIMHNDGDGRISRFVEKPGTPELLDSLRLSDTQVAEQGLEAGGDHYLASMGIYIFKRANADRAARQRDDRLWQAHHPPRHRDAPGFLSRLSGILGGHRNDPILFRGKPRHGQHDPQV